MLGGAPERHTIVNVHHGLMVLTMKNLIPTPNPERICGTNRDTCDTNLASLEVCNDSMPAKPIHTARINVDAYRISKWHHTLEIAFCSA